MAYCYHQAGEPGLAAPLYREAANSQTGRTRARTLVDATRAFLEAGRYDEGLEAVKEALPIASDEIRDEAVSLHYRLLKKRGEDYLAFATAEAALHENPHLGVRFSLALDYRLKGLNELAFFHFKFLYDRDGKNSSSLHNLALLSSDCKLPIAAVERYRAAISSGETLSASNLGYIYLNAGMADEAKDLLGEAMKVQDHVPAVEKCLAEVLQRREGESEKQTEILGDAATRRGFFVAWAARYPLRARPSTANGGFLLVRRPCLSCRTAFSGKPIYRGRRTSTRFCSAAWWVLVNRESRSTPMCLQEG